ncbi:DNA gyrase/topoisomerase IV subunit B [Clostridium beijerinckii]|nr:DNA gyrase/topoisomerase IV subunit B [Clostridium beijerinckii]
MELKNTNAYDVTDLTSLEKLEPVRIRPGMYIGSTGSKGLHHCIWEIIDNSIDEIANGYGNKVTITLNEDKSVTVLDNGRGIPTGIHPIKRNLESKWYLLNFIQEESLIIKIIKHLEDFMELEQQ